MSCCFEELGLDQRLLRSLTKKSIDKTFPIQRLAIPLILEGKDVVAQAHTGSGKTLAYLLPLLHKLFNHNSQLESSSAPSAIILVPTRELTHQVYSVITSFIDLCNVKLKVVQLPLVDLKTALAGRPEVIISTPACLNKCISSGMLKAADLQKSLSTLILDEYSGAMFNAACILSKTEVLKQGKEAYGEGALSRHLRNIPDYLVDPATQEAIKIINLARTAMSSSPVKSKRRKRITEGKFKKSKDPLKTPKRGQKGAVKKMKVEQ